MNEDVTIQRFEIDTSRDPEYDFDILYTVKWDTELVLVQVNLENKEMRRRSVPKPPHYSYTSETMSSETIIYRSDQGYYYPTYNMNSGNVSEA